jgi:hypothetical protein
MLIVSIIIVEKLKSKGYHIFYWRELNKEDSKNTPKLLYLGITIGNTAPFST